MLPALLSFSMPFTLVAALRELGPFSMVPQAHCAAFLSGGSIVRQVGKKNGMRPIPVPPSVPFPKGFMGRTSTGPPLLSFRRSVPLSMNPGQAAAQHHRKVILLFRVPCPPIYTEAKGDFSVKPQLSLFPLPARLSIQIGEKGIRRKFPADFRHQNLPAFGQELPVYFSAAAEKNLAVQDVSPAAAPEAPGRYARPSRPAAQTLRLGRERQCPFRAGAFPRAGNRASCAP